MNNKNLGIRHGDIPLYPINELPNGLKEMENKGSYILAEGETTGHKHVIVSEGLQVFYSADGRLYLKVKNQGNITHQEHKTLTVLPGIYEVGKEIEYNWFEKAVKKVVD